MLKGQPNKALEVLDKAPIELIDKALPEAFVIRSEALLKLDREQSVEKAKAEILTVHPDDPVLLESVAHIEFAQNQANAARDHLLHAYDVAQGPQKQHLAWRIATYYLSRKDFTHAVDYFEKIGPSLEEEPILARSTCRALLCRRSRRHID